MKKRKENSSPPPKNSQEQNNLIIANGHNHSPDQLNPKSIKSTQNGLTACEKAQDPENDNLQETGTRPKNLESDKQPYIHPNISKTQENTSSHQDSVTSAENCKNSDFSEDKSVSSQLQDLRLSEQHQSSGEAFEYNPEKNEVEYFVYENELQMPDIMKLIQKDLSEPYSIYTYRYFIHNWPHLCYMARVNGECVGAIVCKLDFHKKIVKRGYIAMLAVDSGHRKRKIGSTLVKRAIDAMIAEDADEVVLETEITNKPALRLYENLGFVRDKRLFRYYLNGVDALRLKLWLR